MIRVVILGQGLVGTHFAVGLERLKNREINDYGIPLNNKIPISYDEIKVVASYDVDASKIGKTVYEVAKKVFPNREIPTTLKDIIVRQGIHLGSLKGLPFKATGREKKLGFENAMEEIIDEWRSLDADVFINVITTEPVEPLLTLENLTEKLVKGKISASQAYAYMVVEYSKKYRSSAFINAIPSPIANDPAFIELYTSSRAVVFGDDGATGATPLTADILEHLYQRNRRVLDIAQFNIGGNTDFLALNIPERNLMKKRTKSTIVEDILGYSVPNYIRPTGCLEPVGDNKFVTMMIEYLSFNGFKDELYIVARINDSPALAGLLVDLVRLGHIALKRQIYGTVYEVNAFYMKNPGPKDAKAIAKIKAYYRLLEWLGVKDEREEEP